MDNLVLPTVNTGEVQVIYNDQRCYGNVGSYQVPDAAWAKLEAVVANDAPSNWLDGYKATYQVGGRVCVGRRLPGALLARCLAVIQHAGNAGSHVACNVLVYALHSNDASLGAYAWLWHASLPSAPPAIAIASSHPPPLYWAPPPQPPSP